MISYGRHYSGAKIGEGTAKEGMEQPLHYWDPVDRAIRHGLRHGRSAFRNGMVDLFVGALKDQKLVRLVFDGGKPVPVEILFEGAFGRIRDVDFFADGNLYLLTDEDPGALIRVTPVR